MTRAPSLGAMIILSALSTGVGAAQDQPSNVEDVRKELQRMRERIDVLDEQHQADQERLLQLEEQRGEFEPMPPFQPTATGIGQGNLLNPQIAAFLDMGASLSTNGNNDAFNRFNLREAELDFRSAISPSADGVLILAIGEEIEQTAGGTTIDTVFELEEGYIYFHTLPFDLTLKGGKFRNSFGRNNLLHTHALPQVTRPLAIQAFFGPEGSATVGASTSWLVPNAWDKYVELTVEVANADGGEEAPIFGGPDADNPAVIAHLKLFDDIGETSTFEIGGSYLFTHTSGDSDFDANVFGLDLTYQWRDPDRPDSRSVLLQAEFFWAQNDVQGAAGAFRNDSFGMYAFGQYQFEKNWYTGVRFDYTEFPNSEVFGAGDSAWAVSPYISYYLTEFIRLRIEYQHQEFDTGGARGDEDNLLFGLTFAIGSHPGHPYWVNR